MVWKEIDLGRPSQKSQKSQLNLTSLGIIMTTTIIIATYSIQLLIMYQLFHTQNI